MQHYPYLIIGGGMTAYAAIQGVRSVDKQSLIGLFSLEKHPPYNRPPLTKGLWATTPVEKVWLKGDDENVDLHLGRQITSIDSQNKQVHDEQGVDYGYDRMLIATGVSPRHLPYGDGRIIYYRTLDDYQKLRSLTGQGKRFVVIGGGFIGSELAAALAMNGEKVSLVFPDHGIGARIFPHDLSIFLNDFYLQNGVDVRSGVAITGLNEQSGQLWLKTNPGDFIQADCVVAGIGTLPNTVLAEDAGLQVDNGIVVDEYLQTSQPDIYAAGDVASFYSSALGTRMRVEHEDNALTMGRFAGISMALHARQDRLVAYDHLPFFYSDMFTLGYEAVGVLDPRLETFSDWQEPFRQGTVYYLKEGHVRGVLLWNIWGQVDAARKMIGKPRVEEPRNLKGQSLKLAI